MQKCSTDPIKAILLPGNGVFNNTVEVPVMIHECVTASYSALVDYNGTKLWVRVDYLEVYNTAKVDLLHNNYKNQLPC